jgi:hypothetical protein
VFRVLNSDFDETLSVSEIRRTFNLKVGALLQLLLLFGCYCFLLV